MHLCVCCHGNYKHAAVPGSNFRTKKWLLWSIVNIHSVGKKLSPKATILAKLFNVGKYLILYQRGDPEDLLNGSST